MPTNSKPEKIPLVSLDVAPPEGQQYKELYEGHRVYVRKTQGVFQRLRRNIAVPLMLAFFLLPWLQIDDHQAVFLDVIEQKFYVLWWVFWPQDTILLASLLIIAAFALFAVTVWAGRVWCGFTCPQTIWTSIFIWIEDFCEGDRNRRIRLDAAPWSLEKIRKKASKHILWGLVAVATGTTFIAYFYGMVPLVKDLATAQISLESFLWTLLFVVLTYLNAGYMREQVCKHMCPYSRFQSVMYDQTTLMVSYDEKRGDPRGPRKARSDYKKDGLGACIDCDWCVQVCPADIDIRDGWQAECINCGLCIDACDNVMERMGYQKGLIRFASALDLGGFWQRFKQPRMLGYSLCLVLMSGLFLNNLGGREPLSIDVIRDRGVHLYRERNGQIENVYTVKLNNMSDRPMEVQLGLAAKQGFSLSGRRKHYLEAGEVFTVPLRISIPAEGLAKSNYQIAISATHSGNAEAKIEQKVAFIAPVKS
ncbi:cytochrome c oxidase accessory protein CcoG [uncultured Pseudoteredinibacter sp.]|uniref:cytochrome c oxidase accessory protein CcoG n=1 Tax=uncultured Pseudoteredinibacter sp. TaxID=1641701 RepID=UPI002609952E|nr:cytochrome c oxidase accessory protein CcoG [uncultured Pseudoteredinibacter sp.]